MHRSPRNRYTNARETSTDFIILMDRPLLRSDLAEAKYRAVLLHWRRSHTESALLAQELRGMEASYRTRAINRCLRLASARCLSEAWRQWSGATTAIAAAAAVRKERAAVKEAEAQLALAQEASMAAHTKIWQLEQREEDDLELYAALDAGDTQPSAQQGPPPAAPLSSLSSLSSRQARAAQPQPPPPPPLAPSLRPIHETEPFTPAHAGTAVAKVSAAYDGLGPPPQLGSLAGKLLAAWRRESDAAGCCG